jgi:hypothetical protein
MNTVTIDLLDPTGQRLEQIDVDNRAMSAKQRASAMSSGLIWRSLA